MERLELTSQVKHILRSCLGTRAFNYAATEIHRVLFKQRGDCSQYLTVSVTGEAAIIAKLETLAEGESGYILKCKTWRYPSGGSILPSTVQAVTSLLVTSLTVWLDGAPASRLYVPAQALAHGLIMESRSLKPLLQRPASTCTVTASGHMASIAPCPSCGQRVYRPALEMMYTCPTCQAAWIA